MSDVKSPARPYNQVHMPRKYTPGRRRVSVYVTWSYPAEANRDELPVLQHLLKRLWEQWAAAGGTGTIDSAGSEQIGSWNNAIDLDAESVFGSLDPRAQDAIALVHDGRLAAWGVIQQVRSGGIRALTGVATTAAAVSAVGVIGAGGPGDRRGGGGCRARRRWAVPCPARDRARRGGSPSPRRPARR